MQVLFRYLTENIIQDLTSISQRDGRVHKGQTKNGMSFLYLEIVKQAQKDSWKRNAV